MVKVVNGLVVVGRVGRSNGEMSWAVGGLYYRAMKLEKQHREL
jgi:hypothetical protein